MDENGARVKSAVTGGKEEGWPSTAADPHVSPPD